MAKILLVDDCLEIGAIIKSALTTYGIDQSQSIADAMLALQDEADFDLLLIDVTLPDGNGFELCAKLNVDPRFKMIPKIMLTAKTNISEKLYGFSCGADDYITKPCNMLELKARVDRHVQRNNPKQEEHLSLGPFEFHPEFQKCYVVEPSQKTDLELTPTEFRILLALVRNGGSVLTRRDIEKQVWQTNGVTIETRGVDAHVAHLRKKLKSLGKSIVSVYGKGYSFQDFD